MIYPASPTSSKDLRKKQPEPEGRLLAFLLLIAVKAMVMIIVAFAVYLLMALWSYHPADSGFFISQNSYPVMNQGGVLGAWWSDMLFTWFGWVAFLIPLLALGHGISYFLRLKRDALPLLLIRILALVCLIIGACILATFHISNASWQLPMTSGGLIGYWLSVPAVVTLLKLPGINLLAITLVMLGITFYGNLNWGTITEQVGHTSVTLSRQIWHSLFGGHSAVILRSFMIAKGYWHQLIVRLSQVFRLRIILPSPATANKQSVARAHRLAPATARDAEEINVHDVDVALMGQKPNELASIRPSLQPTVSIDKEKYLKIVPLADVHRQDTGSGDCDQAAMSIVKPMGLPKITLLDLPEANTGPGYTAMELKSMSQLLEHKLLDFGIIAKVVEVNPGPVITRFEIQPAPGTKVIKISNLAKDLARSMAILSVRVVEVIAGKSVIGLEIPNQHRQMVRLRQVLDNSAYQNSDSPLALALGHDISGMPVVVNLASMPHLLVAGTTGSGKSVGVNAMLISLLFKATPEQVRLLMIDPKMLELSIYDGIPHLLAPVITDMKEAAGGLRWCVAEMERRYQLMAAQGVRNIAGFNAQVNQATEQGRPIPDPLWQPEEHAFANEQQPHPNLETLPYIVVVIDEFADMMMIVGKKVEELIARIAQKARAAGIHLILATQRPSVDVITGLIKANIPTRIAFQVSSKIDSRTILDQGGAEQLLGHGDMLYLSAGKSLPERVHGAFVADHEVHCVVKAWKQCGQPKFVSAILEGAYDQETCTVTKTGNNAGLEDEQDPLYDEAVAFVTESGRASISSVQRKFKVGYNRAARMIEAMEAAGVISSQAANGSREVLAPPPIQD